MRVLALTRYGVLGASTRVRFVQYFTALELNSIEVEWQILFDDVDLTYKYRMGKFSLWQVIRAYTRRIKTLVTKGHFDVIWIEKEALPFTPLFLEVILLRGIPYILDYDDALFHNYDLNSSNIIRFFLGKRIDKLMSHAALVVCGNSYLATRARIAGAQKVEEIPTVIDLDRYPKISKNANDSYHDNGSILRIVWIGSPSTQVFLEILREPLKILAKKIPFILRIIGANFSLPGVNIECLKWSEVSEVALISDCDVGVMPLHDSDWERGKCGYKLIQYMACGLPVVASPVGINTEIVQTDVNGFLVSSSDEWVKALEILLLDCSLRQKFGLAGRKQVEDFYCVQKTGPRLIRSMFQVERVK